MQKVTTILGVLGRLPKGDVNPGIGHGVGKDRRLGRRCQFGHFTPGKGKALGQLRNIIGAPRVKEMILGGLGHLLAGDQFGQFVNSLAYLKQFG